MQSFLHKHCKYGMCEDCISIAQEYQELEQLRKQELYRLKHEVDKLKRSVITIELKAKLFEQVAKAGIGKIISAWIDKEIDQIITKEIEA